MPKLLPAGECDGGGSAEPDPQRRGALGVGDARLGLLLTDYGSEIVPDGFI